MLGEVKSVVEYLFSLNVPAPVVAAVITALFAVILGLYAARAQKIISRDKIRNDNALKMIDDWLGADWDNKRRSLVQYLVLNAPDNFEAISKADPARALTLRRVMNQLEKINALCIARAVDEKLIANTLGDRITFWYVYGIEGFSSDSFPGWASVITRLVPLKKLTNRKLAAHLRRDRDVRRAAMQKLATRPAAEAR